MNAGENIHARNASWSFSGEVPKQFEKHVEKSVPLYKEGHQLILELSDFFMHERSLCYEIGCSTGILTKKLADYNRNKNCKVVGIDVEADMINHAIKRYGEDENVGYVCENILAAKLEPCDMIVSYYTIQFIPPAVRQVVFSKIYNSLKWGGAFLCFEKVRAPDARFQDITTSLYTEYKIRQGYEAGEILAKSRSLKGVLEPFSTGGNADLLTRAGFSDIMTIMKYVCFEGFLAIK